MPSKPRKPTKFEVFKKWCLRKKTFRFREVTREFGPYASSEHIYLNSLRRHKMIKQVSRGLYKVVDPVRMRTVTTGDLYVRSQLPVLRRKIEDYRKDFYRICHEAYLLREKIKELTPVKAPANPAPGETL